MDVTDQVESDVADAVARSNGDGGDFFDRTVPSCTLKGLVRLYLGERVHEGLIVFAAIDHSCEADEDTIDITRNKSALRKDMVVHMRVTEALSLKDLCLEFDEQVGGRLRAAHRHDEIEG